MDVSAEAGRRGDIRRGARRRRRLHNLAMSTLLVAGATVMGLGAAGGTYALLSASKDVEGSGLTITTKSFDLIIGGESPVANISPSTPTARAFTVTSVGEVPSTLSVQIAPITGMAIMDNTEIRITSVKDAAECVVGRQGISDLLFAPVPGYTFSPPEVLAAGGIHTFCLEVRLKPETPVSQSGQGVPFTLMVTGTQRRS